MNNLFQNALQVFGVVRDEFALTSKPSSNSLDYSFITPTLLAIGKINDANVDELLHVLQGQSALFWNLSGKTLSPTVPEKLYSQFLDNPWVTPGHFTQAPSLECVFRQCYSIKAWLDLKDDHIAVLHCGNGRYRTGILIACYLKYIGAFDKSAEAFDFFCGARLKKDAIPTLSPSYRILFENVDRSTDYGGSPNPFPLHLRCLSISGLPVDEIPCVEVWDMSGLVFSSHRGNSYNQSMCSWSAEYGDGFYRVGMDIIGDFSVMCRFGGSHALTRDKTTLIFKYQNSTAFLPPDVVELAKHNVDLNPEYADSLEEAVFSMHLMFDTVDESSLSKAEFREFAESYQLRGKEAFEAGLDEISKYHVVVPNTSLFQQLLDMKFPPEYIPVALQLGNNDLSMATSYMALLLGRAQSLKGVKSPRPAIPESPYHVKLQKMSLGVRRSGEKARMSMQNLQIEDIKTKLFDDTQPRRSRSHESSTREKDKSRSSRRERDRPIRSTAGSQENATSVEQNIVLDHAVAEKVDSSITARRVSRSPPPPEAKAIAAENDAPVPFTSARNDCGLCTSSDFSLRDQLVPCTKCGQSYHTKCFGGKRIPFSIKSIKERTNRDRYLAKYFSDWVCPVCVERQFNSSTIQSSHESLSDDSRETTVPVEATPSANHGTDRSERTLASKLFGNFLGYARSYSKSASGVTPESEVDNGDTVNPLFVPSGKVGYKQAGSPMPTKSGKSLSQTSTADVESEPSVDSDSSPGSDQKHEDFEKVISLLASCGVSIEELLSMSEEKQKETLMSVTTQLKRTETPPISSPSVKVDDVTSNPTPISSPRNPETISDGQIPLTPELLQKLAKSDPKFAKYSKMFQVGLPLKTIEEKIKADGIDLSQMASTSTETISESPSPASASLDTKPSTPALSPSAEIKPSTPSTPTPRSPPPSLPVDENKEVIIGEDDHRFLKYFQMMKLGLPKLAVAHKMVTDGATPTTEVAISILDHKPILPKVLLEAAPKPEEFDQTAEKPLENEPQVTFIEHPDYGKYFRMVKAGIPIAAVKVKMEQEGFDATFLDYKPTDLVPANLPKKLQISTADEEMVACKDHPVYSKYFKMLKVGLPLANVRAKMEQEGYDPSILDKSPDDMVPVEVKKDDPGPGEMVPLQDHPAYGKYLRMLKVGLPLVAAKQKMIDDGFDPTVLDKGLTDLVPLDTNYRAPEPKVKRPAKSPAAKIRKKKLHWKALDKSRVGADSVWAADDDDDGFQLDEEEFEQLFVQRERKGETKTVVADQKKKTVVLVDPKRAQNAGIALARLKRPFIEVRDKIIEMDERAFSADQYTSLMEYLPTAEEVSVLRGYRGELELLGPAERYMMVMIECPDAQKRIKCILFRQQFRNRKEELINAIRRLEGVCDDVKMSIKLKKVLKTILKVGNQLNDGEDHMGFTVDSLLKLQSQKAFDKKTSILQYVVRLISRNDETCLAFPEDLVHLTESERLSIDQVMSEMSLLLSSYNVCKDIVSEIADRDGKQRIKSMSDFLHQVEQQLDDINLSIEVMKTKYQSVLAYFGEEATLPSQEFFSTLEKFVKAFIEEREICERLRRAEEKKSAQERQRRSTQAGIEIDTKSLQVASQPPAPQANSTAQQSSTSSPSGAPDRRRLGPNGAIMARRNSSYM